MYILKNHQNSISNWSVKIISASRMIKISNKCNNNVSVFSKLNIHTWKQGIFTGNLQILAYFTFRNNFWFLWQFCRLSEHSDFKTKGTVLNFCNEVGFFWFLKQLSYELSRKNWFMNLDHMGQIYHVTCLHVWRRVSTPGIVCRP